MASFAARRSPRAAWSVEESARFAALKEFELLRLLSTRTGRPSRRHVVSASPSPNRSRPHPQLLMVKLLRQCLVPLPTLRRWSRRRRMRANGAALRGARGTTLRCEPQCHLTRSRHLQLLRL